MNISICPKLTGWNSSAGINFFSSNCAASMMVSVSLAVWLSKMSVSCLSSDLACLAAALRIAVIQSGDFTSRNLIMPTFMLSRHSLLSRFVFNFLFLLYWSAVLAGEGRRLVVKACLKEACLKKVWLTAVKLAMVDQSMGERGGGGTQESTPHTQ